VGDASFLQRLPRKVSNELDGRGWKKEGGGGAPYGASKGGVHVAKIEARQNLIGLRRLAHLLLLHFICLIKFSIFDFFI
jgi:hypothetical protein